MELGGKTLTADFTDLTNQAHGSVILRYGETAILVTAVMEQRENPTLPFFPLSVIMRMKSVNLNAHHDNEMINPVKVALIIFFGNFFLFVHHRDIIS